MDENSLLMALLGRLFQPQPGSRLPLGGRDARIGPAPAQTPFSFDGLTPVATPPIGSRPGLLGGSNARMSAAPPPKPMFATGSMAAMQEGGVGTRGPGPAMPNLPAGPDMFKPQDASLNQQLANSPTMAGTSNKELPFETFQRLTGQQWTGGRSDTIRQMLQELGIGGEAGTAQTNIALQKALINNAKNIQG